MPTGALEGVSVVELASEWAAYAGKLLAELGADVVLVEPPGGHFTRTYGPFVDDRPDPEGSLWFWHYNTSKQGVTLDLDASEGRDGLRSLLSRADVFLEAEPPGRLHALGLDYPRLKDLWPDLLMASVSPFGAAGPRCNEQATDLTILATGGPVWSCGYDDHSIPPVRGGGNQALHIGGHFAVMSLLVAILERESGHRDRVPAGQFIDVNLNAAANVTTEVASYGWLAAQQTVQRQTGRHASPVPTQPTQYQCADGRWLTTGTLPRRPNEFATMVDWLTELGLIEAFPLSWLLELGAQQEDLNPARIPEEPIIAEIFAASREATAFIASNLPAQEAFIGFQERGIAVGVVNSPEEAMVDAHFAARGFPTTVDDDRLGRSVTYPGAPYRFSRTPWKLRGRSPRLGEHNDKLL